MDPQTNDHPSGREGAGRNSGCVANEGAGSALPDSMPTAGSPFPVSRIPVVNVATVPQRSPLRYPGGKTWLVPHVRKWLAEARPEILIEPFAGGATVSLTAVMEDAAPSAVMIELDRDVAAFWRAALECGQTLCEWIREFDPSQESLRRILSGMPETVAQHGFRTLVLNRTRRGGILAPGASFIRTAGNGRDIAARWYPETLVRRLAEIQRHADRLVFLEGDGMKALPALLRGWGKAAAVFVDPPHAARGGKSAGTRLHSHSEADHAGLFPMLAESGTNFLMTHDASAEIVGLVRRHGFAAARVQMKNSHHDRVAELVITPDPLFA